MPPSNWIPVSERLPEKNIFVLVLEAYRVDIGFFVRSATRGPIFELVRENDYTDEVTHWQPLPDPPEKEGA